MSINEIITLLELARKKDDMDMPSLSAVEIFDCEPDVFKEILSCLLV